MGNFAGQNLFNWVAAVAYIPEDRHRLFVSPKTMARILAGNDPNRLFEASEVVCIVRNCSYMPAAEKSGPPLFQRNKAHEDLWRVTTWLRTFSVLLNAYRPLPEGEDRSWGETALSLADKFLLLDTEKAYTIEDVADHITQSYVKCEDDESVFEIKNRYFLIASLVRYTACECFPLPGDSLSPQTAWFGSRWKKAMNILEDELK